MVPRTIGHSPNLLSADLLTAALVLRLLLLHAVDDLLLLWRVQLCRVLVLLLLLVLLLVGAATRTWLLSRGLNLLLLDR
jgi:hypothetical protein